MAACTYRILTQEIIQGFLPWNKLLNVIVQISVTVLEILTMSSLLIVQIMTIFCMAVGDGLEPLSIYNTLFPPIIISGPQSCRFYGVRITVKIPDSLNVCLHIKLVLSKHYHSEWSSPPSTDFLCIGASILKIYVLKLLLQDLIHEIKNYLLSIYSLYQNYRFPWCHFARNFSNVHLKNMKIAKILNYVHCV